jgi:hypothetical protein
MLHSERRNLLFPGKYDTRAIRVKTAEVKEKI